MMIDPIKPNQKWFSGAKISFASSNVDVEAGIIRNVILCQVGEAKGHGVSLEQSFIDDLHTYAQKHHTKGMKCRFGHPSMSTDALGTEMGRFHDFKVDGSLIRADLHLYNSANLSPTHPQIKDWMLSMAQEDPDAIMTSIVFKPKYEYQYNDEGKRIDIYFCDEKGRWKRCTNKHGEPNKYDPEKDLYVQLDEFYFTDIVDQGAATDKLFSANFNKDKFSVIATEFLNAHPEIDSFLRENPNKLSEFINKRKSNYSEGSNSATITQKIDMKIEMSKYPTFASLLGFESAESSADGMHLQASHLSLLEKELKAGSDALTQVGALKTEKANLETQLSDEKQKVTGLEAEVTQLKQNHVTPPGQANNADDQGNGEEPETEFLSETDARLAELKKVNQ